MIKNDQESKQEINTETYLKTKITKRENKEKIDIIIYLKNRNKNQKNIKKISVRLKSLNIMINKIVLIVYAVI